MTSGATQQVTLVFEKVECWPEGKRSVDQTRATKHLFCFVLFFCCIFF